MLQRIDDFIKGMMPRRGGCLAEAPPKTIAASNNPLCFDIV
jgi:hypothetical protein